MMRTRGGDAGCTLADVFRERAASQPDRLALGLEHEGVWLEWTWRTFWERASAMGATFSAAGVGAGGRVLVVLPDVYDGVPALFGLWAIGAVPIQVGVPYRLTNLTTFVGQLDALARRLEVQGLVVPRGLASEVALHASVAVIPATSLPGADLEASRPIPPDAPAFIQLTSGSTTSPRGVVVTHARLLRHLAAISAALPSHPTSVAVSWLPLHHDMGLVVGLLFPFFNDFPVHMISPGTFRADPLCWLATMSRVRGTICAAPPSAYGLCVRLADRARDAGLDLRSWECAMVGAEPISPALLRRFAAAFVPLGFRESAFFPVYGLAEATVAVTFPRPGEPPRVDVVDRANLERDGRARPVSTNGVERILEFTGVGRPIPGTEVEVVDEHDQPVPERIVGRIRVRSDSLMSCYAGEPDATSETVVNGWLRTGDLGYVADGDLFISGRLKELIIAGGQNIFPSVVEEVAGQDPEVRSGCVAAVGIWSPALATEQIVVVCETRADPPRRHLLAARVRESLRASGIPIERVIVVAAGLLPRTTSGKLRRAALREVLACGGDVEAALEALQSG
jgi:acyl-CoA synthetase (AMP-forming)/AMP-acid ligase II